VGLPTDYLVEFVEMSDDVISSFVCHCWDVRVYSLRKDVSHCTGRNAGCSWYSVRKVSVACDSRFVVWRFLAGYEAI